MSKTARVAGTGSFLPPTAQSNADLYGLESIRRNFDVERARASLREIEGVEDRSPVEVFDLWARQVTGIIERRVTRPEDGHTTESMCAEASRRALEAAGMSPDALDAILIGSVTPSDSVPNASATVGSMIGAPRAGGFTLNGACTGFIHVMATGYAMIRSGIAENVLVCAGDVLTRITNYEDPTTAVLFSDGAGAAVLTASGNGGFAGPPTLSADYAREHLYIRGQGWEEADDPIPKLRMGGGPKVLRRAINAMASVAERALEEAGADWSTVDLVVPHQANLRITRGLEKHLALPKGRVVHNIERYGNCSAATVGIALDEALRGKHGEVPRPARVVLTAVGGGYTTGAAVIDM